MKIAPGQLGTKLQMYVAEAEFFEGVLASDVSKLPRGSHVVEIGAGIGLLALKIADKGFKVTAFEPEASGFTEMHAIREVILSKWIGKVPIVNFIDNYIVAATEIDKPADYMIAINVIEHVPEYEQLIVNALGLKSERATLRLICPNYAIPYEPHFEIPIIFSKKITFKIFRRKIEHSKIQNSKELWQDLSWPTQRQLKCVLQAMGLEFEFSRSATNDYINRALTDSSFIERKGRIIGNLIKCFALLTKYLTRFIPLALIPIIDCRILGTSETAQRLQQD